MAVSSISRIFLLLLVVAFSVVIVFTGRLAYVYADFSNQGTRLVQNLQTTSLLSQELQRRVREQIDLLDHQFELVDPDFPAQLRSIHYGLNQKQNEYLKLDIGEQERLTVEKIRVLQTEMTTLSVQVFELLRSGDRPKATQRLASVGILQQQVEVAFEELYWLQMNKLQTMHQQLSGRVSTAFLTASGLVGGLIIVLVILMTLLRKRVLRPLKAIHEAINRVRQGSFSARAPVNHNDEIGQVAQGFNFMAASLAESYADLEHRVEKRTSQLVGANEELAAEITERKRVEEALRASEGQLLQAQKMEAIGRLAGGIAHDFNNLLTAINGYSELTMLQLKPEDPLMHNIKEVKKAGDRAAALTRQLLAFSRKQVLQPKILDLNVVVSEIEKMLQRLIGEDIELRTVLAPELGHIKGDPGQIEQVIMNLAVNARDAMEGGGKLTIETQNVYLDEGYVKQHTTVMAGSYVMLAVSDTGQGMDEETQKRIFEPFFTTKDVGKGTGLGLSTVYGIIKQSGGHIWIYSEVGQGTTFKVYLPRVDEEAQVYKPSQERQESRSGKETVLLAEDEEMLRNLIRQVLTSFGYQVLEAANGAAALVVCEQYQDPIHLLITDVVMPEMSGRELTGRLAGLRPEMKVLFMSGYTDDTIVRHGILESDLAFLQKPFTPHDLARKVREVLDEDASLKNSL